MKTPSMLGITLIRGIVGNLSSAYANRNGMKEQPAHASASKKTIVQFATLIVYEGYRDAVLLVETRRSRTTATPFDPEFGFVGDAGRLAKFESSG